MRSTARCCPVQIHLVFTCKILNFQNHSMAFKFPIFRFSRFSPSYDYDVLWYVLSILAFNFGIRPQKAPICFIMFGIRLWGAFICFIMFGVRQWGAFICVIFGTRLLGFSKVPKCTNKSQNWLRGASLFSYVDVLFLQSCACDYLCLVHTCPVSADLLCAGVQVVCRLPFLDVQEIKLCMCALCQHSYMSRRPHCVIRFLVRTGAQAVGAQQM